MSRYPVINTGDPFTAEILREMIPEYVWKASTTTRASTTTVADDPDLIFAVEANAVYHIEFQLLMGALDAADIKTRWSVPSGATGNKGIIGPSTNALNSAADQITVRMGGHSFGTEISYNGVRNGTNAFVVHETSIITISSTAGNVALQWAQVTSNATGSVMLTGSMGRCRRIA